MKVVTRGAPVRVSLGGRRRRDVAETIVCGERRSANRTRWTQQRSNPTRRLQDATELDGAPSVDAAPLSTPVIRPRPRDRVWEQARALQPLFFEVDALVDVTSRRVRHACRDSGLGPHHFAGSTGYGHGDLGRQTLDQVVAKTFGAESAVVRPHFVSGTHAIAAALFGVLRPDSTLLCITGSPYDTLHEVIGLTDSSTRTGSLKDWGIDYRQIDLTPEGRVDLAAADQALSGGSVLPVVYLQRSCGYAPRPTLRIQEIREVIACIKQKHPECLILVDNCYGEFTEELEPTHVGADLIMGSLIKNPGATIVSTGGYVAGRRDLVEQVHTRLTAPGIGLDAGSISGDTLRLMFQGFCLAPQMVGEALKSSLLISHVLSQSGYTVTPKPSSERPFSAITAVELGSESKMVQFCSAIQKLCPVGSYVQPIPGATPGYRDAVVFADGTFIDGSTSELTADGPIRPPYTIYCQGGTHWTQWGEILENILPELTSRSQIAPL